MCVCTCTHAHCEHACGKPLQGASVQLQHMTVCVTCTDTGGGVGVCFAKKNPDRENGLPVASPPASLGHARHTTRAKQSRAPLYGATAPAVTLALTAWVCSSSLTRSMGATAVLEMAAAEGRPAAAAARRTPRPNPAHPGPPRPGTRQAGRPRAGLGERADQPVPQEGTGRPVPLVTAIPLPPPL